MKKTSTLLIALMTLIAGCGNKDKFLYVNDLTQNKVHQFTVKEIMGASQVDVLWIIDNSGSMGDEQQTIKNSVQSFMQIFTQKKVNWKMGLISTAVGEQPYIGFETSDILDWQTPNSSSKFATAVGRLGTGGDTTERSFDPMIKHLTNYPSFLRPNTPLAVIMVTDEEEQSSANAKTTMDFLMKTKMRDQVFAFGVFGANDMSGCGTGNGWEVFKDGYGDFLSLATRSKAFSLCQTNFGPDLDKIFDTISQLVSTYTLLLPEAPNPATIKVMFGGKELQGGAQEDGAVWFYNYDLNAISFYTLDFAPDGTTEKVNVIYDKAQ